MNQSNIGERKKKNDVTSPKWCGIENGMAHGSYIRSKGRTKRRANEIDIPYLIGRNGQKDEVF